MKLLFRLATLVPLSLAAFAALFIVPDIDPGWARASHSACVALAVFVIALAMMFAFSPLERLRWAQPMALSNLLVAGLIASNLLEYLVAGVSYWPDRRGLPA